MRFGLGCGRPCDHAAPVPAVLADRLCEGASDSVHRQMPQREYAQCKLCRKTEIPQRSVVDSLVNGSDKLQQFTTHFVQTNIDFHRCSFWTRFFTCPLWCNDWYDGPDSAENHLEVPWSKFLRYAATSGVQLRLWRILRHFHSDVECRRFVSPRRPTVATGRGLGRDGVARVVFPGMTFL